MDTTWDRLLQTKVDHNTFQEMYSLFWPTHACMIDALPNHNRLIKIVKHVGERRLLKY